jgi:predicted phage-related endonuclease
MPFTALGRSDHRESWLKLRRDGTGASEMAAALGVSPYKSERRLYLEKTAGVEDDLAGVAPGRKNKP